MSLQLVFASRSVSFSQIPFLHVGDYCWQCWGESEILICSGMLA
jgi:hypothetical protein